MKLVRLFFTGLFISFLGTLPLGTLNIAAMQLSVTDGVRPAIYFAIGVLLVEIIYVRLSLVAMHWVQKQQRWFRVLQWATLMLVLALAISSFYAAWHPGTEKNVILSNTLHRFWLGAGMSAINPLQIPYWFGWSTVLFTRQVLYPDMHAYNTYTAGIGVGTFFGMAVFIAGGQILVNQLNANQEYINLSVGIVFLLTAMYQAWKLWKDR